MRPRRHSANEPESGTGAAYPSAIEDSGPSGMRRPLLARMLWHQTLAVHGLLRTSVDHRKSAPAPTRGQLTSPAADAHHATKRALRRRLVRRRTQMPAVGFQQTPPGRNFKAAVGSEVGRVVAPEKSRKPRPPTRAAPAFLSERASPRGRGPTCNAREAEAGRWLNVGTCFVAHGVVRTRVLLRQFPGPKRTSPTSRPHLSRRLKAS
jgi:hypothetical protein